jgi:hypothetical protein
MNSVSWFNVILLSLFGIVSLFGIAFALERFYAKRQAKLGRLIRRYNNVEIAHRVVRREVWQGQTARQLLDSRGEPQRKIRPLATPEHEEWIYRRRGLSRRWLQVILENGLVASWGSTTVRPADGSTLRVAHSIKHGFV